MSILETRKPYEMLIRWDENTGVLRGAHIQYYDAVMRDGVQIAGGPSKAYGIGEGLAFPLADVMSTVTSDALARIEALDAQLADKTQQIATLTGTVAERDATIAQRDAQAAQLQARITELEAQLANTQPDPTDVIAAIKAERDRRIQGGVKVGSDWFKSDMQTQIIYIGMLLQGASLPAGTPLWTMDGRNVGATPQRAAAIFGAIGANMATLFTVAAQAEAAYGANPGSFDPRTIAWPPTYEG